MAGTERLNYGNRRSREGNMFLVKYRVRPLYNSVDCEPYRDRKKNERLKISVLDQLIKSTTSNNYEFVTHIG